MELFLTNITKEFFDKGNEENSKKYNGEFPWKSGKLLTISKETFVEVAPGIKIVL
jgi:hypothetical protein